MPSTECWNLDARTMYASYDPNFGWDRCVHSTDPCTTRDRPLIGGIMPRAIGPVGYVAGWGLADGMDAAFGWDAD
jgi:hypothetical protein